MKNNEIFISYKKNDYMKAFLHDYILRPSCYACQFKYNNISSDLIIGDFWGINKKIKKFDDDLGISEILINTKKGESLLSDCINEIEIFPVPLESVLQDALIKSPPVPNDRKRYIEYAKTHTLKETNNCFLQKHFSLFRILFNKNKSQNKNIDKTFNNYIVQIKSTANGSKETCCGCASCLQTCPVNAIKMDVDSEGFYYPSFNLDKCINCNLCIKHCPIVNPITLKKNELAFAAKCKNESIRINSSSGGIFHVIASRILDLNGVVFGSALFCEANSIYAKHIPISNKNDLYKLHGSKYMQSNTETAFKMTRSYLEEGKKVLFSGTPCQIAGLYTYLGKPYDNLFTILIICHGVPSSLFLNKYLQDSINIQLSDICDIKFRDKSYGWRKYRMKIVTKNN